MQAFHPTSAKMRIYRSVSHRARLMNARRYRQPGIHLIPKTRNGDKSREDVRSTRKQERGVPPRAFSSWKCGASTTSPSLSRRLVLIRRTFAPTAEHVEFRLHLSARRLPPSWFRCLERHALRRMYVCTNTPTRDGHAPKRPLITSILLPLTAHYRASGIVSFNLPWTACRSRNEHREGSPPPLKILRFRELTSRSHSRRSRFARAQQTAALCYCNNRSVKYLVAASLDDI